jgi:hypothetical protein
MKNTLMRLAALAVPVLALIGLAGPALADANLNCSAYAGIAVQQQEQNQSLGCGFQGGGWSTDFQAHYQWCASAGVTMANLVTEDEGRKQALNECIARPQLAQEACIEYAQNAVIAAGTAAEGQCGLQGGAWSTDFASHFNWCLTASDANRASETAARANQIQGCYAARAVIRELECNAYAQSAVIQNGELAGTGCNLTGGRWSNDAQAHFNWCMSVDAAATQAEADARNAALGTSCRVTRCWTETHAVLGIPPWEVSRHCKTE